MARILALDYGTKRTGIAVTDELKMIASGLTTVSTEELMSYLEKYFEAEEVELVLVGEPKQKDNSASGSEQYIQEFLKKFSEKFPQMKVERVDERFTSKARLSVDDRQRTQKEETQGQSAHRRD